MPQWERRRSVWDHDGVLYDCLKLSRLVRDNAFSTEYAARIADHEDGVQVIYTPNAESKPGRCLSGRITRPPSRSGHSRQELDAVHDGQRHWQSFRPVEIQDRVEAPEVALLDGSADADAGQELEQGPLRRLLQGLKPALPLRRLATLEKQAPEALHELRSNVRWVAPPTRRRCRAGKEARAAHFRVAAAGRALRAAVYHENEVRAAAGLTLVAGAVAFAFAYFDRQYIPLQVSRRSSSSSSSPG